MKGAVIVMNEELRQLHRAIAAVAETTNLQFVKTLDLGDLQRDVEVALRATPEWEISENFLAKVAAQCGEPPESGYSADCFLENLLNVLRDARDKRIPIPLDRAALMAAIAVEWTANVRTYPKLNYKIVGL
jgi:hypothetical protein